MLHAAEQFCTGESRNEDQHDDQRDGCCGKAGGKAGAFNFSGDGKTHQFQMRNITDAGGKPEKAPTKSM